MRELCTVADEFVKEKVIWAVQLSDGKWVFQDDFRPGLAEPIAWKRLKKYIVESGDFITRMRLQFWDNLAWLPDNALGYYFSYGVGALLNTETSMNLFNAGVLHENGIVYGHQYKVPELVPLFEIERNVNDDDPRLIRCLRTK